VIVPYRIDWSRTYAGGALGDISMARNNSNCAANTYFETREILKVDKAFASDSDYYLNSIEASQQFYLSLLNLKTGWLSVIPLLRWVTGVPLDFFRWVALIGLPVVTMILQFDTEELKPMRSVELQLTEELDANDGKLVKNGDIEISGGTVINT
jgi:hypothetical protein